MPIASFSPERKRESSDQSKRTYIYSLENVRGRTEENIRAIEGGGARDRGESREEVVYMAAASYFVGRGHPAAPGVEVNPL